MSEVISKLVSFFLESLVYGLIEYWDRNIRFGSPDIRNQESTPPVINPPDSPS